MKKLKLMRKSLDELAIVMPPVDEQEQQGFIGGGDSSGYSGSQNVYQINIK